MGIFGFGKKDNNISEPQDTTPKPIGQAYQNSDGQWEQEYEVWNGTTWVRELYIHDGVDWKKKPVTTLSMDALLKKVPDTKGGISLKKSAISLEKSLISLEKKSGVGFGTHRAKVAVVMDYSGSMSSLYRNGTVQNVLTRLMPLALKFDDNGELDVWIFENGYHRLNSMDLGNFDTYVTEEIVNKGYRMGGTSYAPVLEDVMHKYFVEDAATSNIPSFVIFITDGENNDRRDTDKVIKETSYKNMFIQFVGIGYDSFNYLEKLDDLSGRPVDNTGFIRVDDINKVDDETMFNRLLNQYPDWLKAKGLN